MKKALLTIFTIVIFFTSNSQTFQVTFSGTGASETVDEVEIYNLTQGTEIFVGGDDIVNFVTNSTHNQIQYANNLNQSISLYPNPFEHSCIVEFSSEIDGDVDICVVDILGKIIIENNVFLNKGRHTFKISGLSMGLYLLHIKTPQVRYSVKIISNHNFQSSADIVYIQSINENKETEKNKINREEIYFDLALGDLILFKGIADNYSRAVISTIESDININFHFIPCMDADNNNYPVVSIGEQTWMFENLMTTSFSNNENIPNIIDFFDWAVQSNGAYSWYDNSIGNKDVYGALYNWYAIESSNLCPEGWYVPTESDWDYLISLTGGLLHAGGKLKQTSTLLWNEPNYGATNEFGFTALPGGERNLIEDFFNQGNTGAFWTSTENDSETAIYIKMFHDEENLEKNNSYKTHGYSVRCILCDISEIELNISEPSCDENGSASISNYDNELTYTFVPDDGIYTDETGNILGFTFETLYKIVAENEQCQSDTVEFIVEEQLQGSIPTISLIGNADICEDVESFFIDAFVDNYSTLSWTTSGDGIFSKDTVMSPIYQFSPNDYATGTVTLTVTAEPTNICGSSASENIVINLHPEPEIEIFVDDPHCYGWDEYVWLNGNATYDESTEWTCANCNGEIDYETEVIPIYLPTEMDYAVGYNDFIFTVRSLNPCNKIISEKVRVHYLKPDADAGPDQDIYGHTETYLTAKGATTGQSGWWSVVSNNGNEDNFEDYHDNLTKFTGEVGETYELRWNINDNDCWSVDTVVVEFKTIYGDPCPDTPTFIDSRDGQTYNTVQIGNQCWMAENLNYNASGSQCYNLDANNCNTYGKLYNWETAMNGEESTTANPSEVQGVCPDGWHLPSYVEFHRLATGLGYNNATYGVILKSESWDGTNESGFSALPGGFKYYDPEYDYFWNLGDKGYWWCSTETESIPDNAYFMMMQSSFVQIFNSHATKLDKRSIRCVKDIDIPQVSTILNDNVGYNSARSGGVIHNEGESAVTTKGIVWSTTQEPTIVNNIGLLEDDSDENSYVSVMTDLLPETTYYARAFATNSQGTGYGQEISFTTTTDGIPVVEYHSVFDIHSSKAKSGGTISDEGGAVITQYGLIWSTNPNVDMDNYQRIIALNESTSIFDTTMTELTPSTTYYVKAYAINAIGIGYANEMSFTTLEPGDGEHCMGISSFTDSRDGNEYQVVSIGTRCWMSENLKYLPDVHSFSYKNDSDPRYYVVGYHGENGDVDAAKLNSNYQNYGVLYNHPAASDVCPEGWHLPTWGEWQDLINYVDDTFDGGLQLRSCRTVNSILGGDCNTSEHPRWDESTLLQDLVQGSDDFGFSALPAGWIVYEGDDYGTENKPGSEAIFWSLSFDTPLFFSKVFRIDLDNLGYEIQTFRENNGFSVRCVKD